MGLTLQEMQNLAFELGVEIPESRPARMTTQPPPAQAVGKVREMVAGYTATATATRSVPEVRVGHAVVDWSRLVHDPEERNRVSRHEAGHAVAAALLNWEPLTVDIAKGEMTCRPPDGLHGYQRALESAIIAASGAAWAGTSGDRPENQADRSSVRLDGWVTWAQAFEKAQRLVHDEVARPIYDRLVAALLDSPTGRLEGAALAAVLEGPS